MSCCDSCDMQRFAFFIGMNYEYDTNKIQKKTFKTNNLKKATKKCQTIHQTQKQSLHSLWTQNK